MGLHRRTAGAAEGISRRGLAAFEKEEARGPRGNGLAQDETGLGRADGPSRAADASGVRAVSRAISTLHGVVFYILCPCPAVSRRSRVAGVDVQGSHDRAPLLTRAKFGHLSPVPRANEPAGGRTHEKQDHRALRIPCP